MTFQNNNIDPEEFARKNRVAQWVYDTLPILNRFHLWIKDVQTEQLSGSADIEAASFLQSTMVRSFVMAAAATALGTRLFGRFGEGKGKDKDYINQVKKDADAISAYALSESLWHLSRSLPENHAILICLGEGLLPKAGETPDMGANPLLGFGRIYARPQVAKLLEHGIHRLINDKTYTWDNFYREVTELGLTIWGAAIDTLENTNRFAIGAETGPITVLHLFDQPLMISKPYEGYMGTFLLPQKIVEKAEEKSIIVNVNTPRKLVMEAIKDVYPHIRNEHIHVWTLQGPSRAKRIGSLWAEWEALGVDLVQNGDVLHNNFQAFTSSGTYAPTFTVGEWHDENGDLHLFLVDGYAASAEAAQGATLAKMLGLSCSLVMFSPRFSFSHEIEKQYFRLDPTDACFAEKFTEIVQPAEFSAEEIEEFRMLILEAKESGFPHDKRAFDIDELFPKKEWDGAAIIGYMLNDPYSGEPEVKKIDDSVYQVSVRMVTPRGMNRYIITLEFRDPWEICRKIFNPLLDRFVAGESFQERPVKKSDSGRIRNELQTLCSQALEHFGDGCVRLQISQIDDLTMPPAKKEQILEILQWFKVHHPLWFEWLEIEE